jgi:hypothetical protein
MKRYFVLSMLVVFLMMCVVGCGGKSTGLEGKVVDGKGQPLAGVKVVAKMSEPVKGYEQFETKTGSDGSFVFDKLFPESEYKLIFRSERWITDREIRTESGPKGEPKVLPDPVTIRFMDSKGGVVLDSKTNLMWASRDNGSNITWYSAKNYCENYRGGGYTGWRMPLQDELAKLHESGNYKSFITVESGVWAAETRGSDASRLYFNFGNQDRSKQSDDYGYRVLPVRSGK